MEYPLIDIDTHSYYRVFDSLSHQAVLYQDTANLPVSPIDVIRPFDIHVTNLLTQSIGNGERNRHGDGELSVGRDTLWMIENGEQQVLVTF